MPSAWRALDAWTRSCFDPSATAAREAQQDLLTIRSRAALVSARTTLVNCIRGQVKASSFRLPSVSTRALRQASLGDLPRALREALAPMVAAVESLTEQIKAYDRRIDALAKKYTASEQLTQVIGVGNLTAVAFLLVLADPDRFEKSRDVGAYLGLVPRRDQSGETDKQLRITKAGDRMLRTLLVQCAHYILGRNGPPCDLKRHGERIAARGGAIAKRKAVIAVARKLACLLHALWRTGEIYEPNRHLAASVPCRHARSCQLTRTHHYPSTRRSIDLPHTGLQTRINVPSRVRVTAHFPLAP